MTYQIPEHWQILEVFFPFLRIDKTFNMKDKKLDHESDEVREVVDGTGDKKEAKGQLILKCRLGVIVWTKIATKVL